MTTPDTIVQALPDDRKAAMQKLRDLAKKHLPKGFEETVQYGMISYVVPLSTYPDGYHCKASEPLPFISIASQKNFIALYHMGLYATPAIEAWFKEEYAKRVPSKLDMGKSCIRFKKVEQIPFDVLGELFKKITVKEWIATYEAAFKKGK